MFDSALELLALVQGDHKASLSDLATALDHVASAFADAPRGSFVADCVPRPDIKVDRELISRRFPELGLYATSDPLDLEGKPLVLILQLKNNRKPLNLNHLCLRLHDHRPRLTPASEKRNVRSIYFSTGLLIRRPLKLKH